MSRWSNLYISKGGRHTILPSVLSNLPTYYLSLFSLPRKAEDQICKLFRDFLWEGSSNNGKPHLVNWKQVQLPLKEGGLGVGNIKHKNTALLSKWIWQFISEKHHLWRTLIAVKYMRTSSNTWPFSSNTRHKGPWSSILNHSHLIKDFALCSMQGRGKQPLLILEG